MTIHDEATDDQAPPHGLRLLARMQVRHPLAVLGCMGAITVVAVWLAFGLEVRTGFESLLPDDRPSVQELKRVAARTAGVSTLFVVLQGGQGTPVSALRKAADELVEEIGKSSRPGSAASRTACRRRDGS